MKIMRRLISELRQIRRMNLLQFVVIPEMSMKCEICNWKYFRIVCRIASAKMKMSMK